MAAKSSTSSVQPIDPPAKSHLLPTRAAPVSVSEEPDAANPAEPRPESQREQQQPPKSPSPFEHAHITPLEAMDREIAEEADEVLKSHLPDQAPSDEPVATTSQITQDDLENALAETEHEDDDAAEDTAESASGTSDDAFVEQPPARIDDACFANSDTDGDEGDPEPIEKVTEASAESQVDTSPAVDETAESIAPQEVENAAPASQAGLASKSDRAAPAKAACAQGVEAKPSHPLVALLIAVLVVINSPLRLLPESIRPIVNWFALSLLFWVPAVWIIALLLAGR